MAHVRKRSPNTYVITVFLGRDKNGKRINRYETFYGTSHQANRRAAELETELKKRCGPKGADVILSELMDRWLDNVKDSLYIRTYEKYLWHVKRLKPLIGDLKLYTLNSLELQERLKGIKGLSDRTKRDLFATVRTVLRQVQNWGMTTTDLSSGLKIPRINFKRRHFLNLEELSLLLEASKGYKYYLVIRIVAVTGFRIGEALGLRWGCIDFNKGLISIEQASDIKKRTIKETKNPNSLRRVKLDNETLSELKKLWDNGNDNLDDLIFRPEAGSSRPIRYNSVRNTLKRALRKAGLKDIRLHDLRHGAGSIMLDEGVPLTTVADTLGDRPQTIVQIYAQNNRQGEGVGRFLESDKSVDKSHES